MYGIDDPRPASSRMMALIGRIFIETIPQWLAVGGMLGLIFGGCCSNVSTSPGGGACTLVGEREAYVLLGICAGSYCQVSYAWPFILPEDANIFSRVEPDSGMLKSSKSLSEYLLTIPKEPS